MLGVVEVGAQDAQAADEYGHLWWGERQQGRLVDQQIFSWRCISCTNIIAEAVRGWFKHCERMRVGLILRSISAACNKWNRHFNARSLRGMLNSGASGKHNEIGDRNLLLACSMCGIEFTANRFNRLENIGEFSRIVDRPILLRCKTNARAVGAATLVGAAEGGRGGPRCGYQLRNCETCAEHLRLERCDILRSDQRVRDGRHWVLPDEHFLWNERPKVTNHRTHVTVRQLEPCARKRIRELLGILEEPTRNRLVVWIHTHRQIRGQHDRRVALRSVVRIRYGGGCRFIGGDPLMRTGWTLGEFPFVAEQGFKVAVVPRGGRCGPRAFEAAGDGVASIAGSKAVLPAKAHLL